MIATWVSVAVTVVLIAATFVLAYRTKVLSAETATLSVQNESLRALQVEFQHKQEHERLRPRVEYSRVLPMPTPGDSSIDYKLRVVNVGSHAYRVSAGEHYQGGGDPTLASGELLGPNGHIDLRYSGIATHVDLRFKPEGFECPCGNPLDDHWLEPVVPLKSLGYAA